MIVVATGWMKE